MGKYCIDGPVGLSRVQCKTRATNRKALADRTSVSLIFAIRRTTSRSATDYRALSLARTFRRYRSQLLRAPDEKRTFRRGFLSGSFPSKRELIATSRLTQDAEGTRSRHSLVYGK